MEAVDTIARLLQTIAWPITLIVAIFLLRKPLQGLLPKMESTEFLGFKAQFRQQVKEIGEATAEFTSVPFVGLTDSHQGLGSDENAENHVLVMKLIDRAWRDAQAETRDAQVLAASQPQAAVLSSARVLRTKVDALYMAVMHEKEKNGVAVENREPFAVLEESGSLNKKMRETVQSLMSIASDVRSGKRIDPESASLYVVSVTELVTYFMGVTWNHERTLSDLKKEFLAS